MKVAVLDKNGKDTGRKVDLSKDVFGIEPNNHALYLDVKQYLAIKGKVRTSQKNVQRLRVVHEK